MPLTAHITGFQILFCNEVHFIDEIDVVTTKWYEEAWFQNMVGQLSTVLILAIITFGALKPLLNRILVPSGGVSEGMVTDSYLESDAD